MHNPSNLCSSLLYPTLYPASEFFFSPLQSILSPSQTTPPPPIDHNSPTNINHLVFGLVGSLKAWRHRKAYIESWWRPNVTRGYLYLDTAHTEELLPWSAASLPLRVSDDISELVQESGHVAPIMVRMVHAILEVYREGDQGVRWNYVQANAKLALFYDWLFLDERLENVMNIEPAILVIVRSIPKYIDVAHTLLEFLFLLMENYDVGRKDIINHGVLSAFCMLVRKGVVRSLDILVNCDAISPVFKQRLVELFSGMKATVSKELQPVLKACSLDLLKASGVEAQNTVAGNMHEQ
ncbi:hypothetical protein RHMOL_Rhmol13G0287000 [Rhododendron molle]|uniref:Uncharacterized protein n=1 Tax=Rhododendron molle TaxID=49168 RepID=A0ACC0LBR3_RHOML|nr:hypothetical protein RHMOL_Rhmol13G0287000 [Rhododendron molle]